MGTRIQNVQVTRVTDGDTVRIRLDGESIPVRVPCADTEESHSGGSKPVTRLGQATTAMAKQYFQPGSGLATVEIEFDTDDPVDVCLVKHRDNFGRLLCYLHKDGENFIEKLVREGWSPYFVKYGRSRQYHRLLVEAEAQAQSSRAGVWDRSRSDARPYGDLVPWWAMRDGIVQDYRHHLKAGGTEALSVRLDHGLLVQKARNGEEVTVLCDFQNDATPTASGGRVLRVGSPQHPLSLFVSDDADEFDDILTLLAERYIGAGKRNYAYVTGPASLFGTAPQISVTALSQISDFPPA